MTFTARYPGRCAGECGERIAVGDQVTYDDDQLVHAACEGTTPAQQPAPAPCPTCWLVGPCDC